MKKQNITWHIYLTLFCGGRLFRLWPKFVRSWPKNLAKSVSNTSSRPPTPLSGAPESGGGGVMKLSALTDRYGGGGGGEGANHDRGGECGGAVVVGGKPCSRMMMTPGYDRQVIDRIGATPRELFTSGNGKTLLQCQQYHNVQSRVL